MMSDAVSSRLEDLLAQAREADPMTRIELRDPIASHGEAAIDAMADWISDPRLAAFAIRVLERIGRDQNARAGTVAILAAVDRADLPPSVVGDLDRAISALGGPTPRSPERTTSGIPTERPKGLPGVPGRGYWVLRTSPWERPYLWAEALAGRLRQGWGVADEQNLEVIAAAVRRGDPLTGLQKEARLALRMLTSWDGGMRLGDLVVAPNLPDYGRLSVFRVAGSYEWSLAAPRRWDERFGHILPVELVASNVDRRSPGVSDGLRAALRSQTRLYNITSYGGDVERLIRAGPSRDDRG
jgi:hypothetical protein